MISPDHVCVYCKKTLAEHTDVNGLAEWVKCPAHHDRVVLKDAAHFREPGCTVKCDRCGHEQVLPENISRHLGSPAGYHRP